MVLKSCIYCGIHITLNRQVASFALYKTLRKIRQTFCFFFLQVIQGLVYLNNFGTVNCNLSPDNILIDPYGQTKLYNYGLYYMTEAGTAVSFPLG